MAELEQKIRTIYNNADTYYEFSYDAEITLKQIKLTEIATALEYFSSDLDSNLEIVSLLLPFIPASELSVNTRVNLGLTPFPVCDHRVINPPTIQPITEDPIKHKHLCGESEKYLVRTRDPLLAEKSTPKQFTVPIQLNNCLAGKIYSFINGLCFETKEFSNGSVMLKNVWYNLASMIDEITLRNLVSQHINEQESLGRDPSLIVLDLPNFGGNWTPARSLHSL